MTARSEEMEARYQAARKAGTLKNLADEASIKEWKHWKLVQNRFPHDKLNTVHDLIVLKRNVHESNYWGLHDAEILELFREILPELDVEYDYFKINGHKCRSVTNTFHVHVCDHKEEYL